MPTNILVCDAKLPNHDECKSVQAVGGNHGGFAPQNGAGAYAAGDFDMSQNPPPAPLPRPPAKRSGVPAFLVMEVMTAAAQAEARGESVIHMEVGQPGTPAPAKALEAVARVLPRTKWGTRRHWVCPHCGSVSPSTTKSGMALPLMQSMWW